MSPDDIIAGMALVEEAGWNQVPSDWTMMLRLGRGFAIRDDSGTMIASSMILPYPPRFGWIGMVLVRGWFRRRGLATRLLRRAVEDIEQAGLVPMLDATPAGKRVYDSLGFSPVLELQRWRGKGSGAGHHFPGGADLTAAAAMDGAAFGADRSALLADFAARGNCFAVSAASGDTHVFTRSGRTATQIGPVLSADDDAAASALGATLDVLQGSVLLDVPVRESRLATLLSDRGFTVERPFTRMARGAVGEPILGAAARVTAGAELG
ncbi:MAG TPA: GNAT family N-acetyltransferase [Devosiaceae bacterium]|jgi:ribosomal protein S18 acetylase RimI-like enzyme|nr:GNAT family N-acetyltransferase [Devosiaceae bacterium]